MSKNVDTVIRKSFGSIMILRTRSKAKHRIKQNTYNNIDRLLLFSKSNLKNIILKEKEYSINEIQHNEIFSTVWGTLLAKPSLNKYESLNSLDYFKKIVSLESLPGFRKKYANIEDWPQFKNK